MFIYEGNRDWVEGSLRSLIANAAVARAISRAGAKLDGTDPVMVLCAVDDLLIEEFGPAGSPLQPPPGVVDPRLPSLTRAILALHDRARGYRLRARETGVPPPVIDLGAATAELRRRYKIEREKFDATPRFRDATRTWVETPPPSIDANDLRMRVSRVPADRAEYARFAEAMKRLKSATEDLNTVGRGVQSAFLALGCSEDQLFLDVDADELDEFVNRADGDELDSKAVQAQSWLLEQLSQVVESPTRLVFRSETASQIRGCPGPYLQHGPASLLEATQTWLHRWAPAEKVSIEAEAKELVEKAADQVVEQLLVGMSWLEDAAPASVRERASTLRWSLGEDLFNGCVSFDDGSPGYQILKALLVGGAHRADWQSPFPKRRKRKSLSTQQVMKLKKAIKLKVTKRKVTKRKVTKRKVTKLKATKLKVTKRKVTKRK